MIALHTGTGKGEILKLCKEWINFPEAVIIVSRHHKKRKKKDKRVPINSEARPFLRRLARKAGESGCLFENPKTGRPCWDVKRSWLQAVKKAGRGGKPGVDRLRIHDLRQHGGHEADEEHRGHETGGPISRSHGHPDDGQMPAS